MVAILLIGLRNYVYERVLDILFVFSSFMYFVMWGFLISLQCSGRGVGSENLHK
jgi:hypothetical protein